MDSHVNGFLPALVLQLAREHPRISLEIEIGSTDAAATALVSGAADIAAVFNLSPRRDLHVLWAAELPFGCVVAPGHALARKKHRSACRKRSPIRLRCKAAR